MRSAMIALLSALFLFGCAPAPDMALPACKVCRFGELRPGVSTTAEAVALLGAPNSISQLGNGTGIMTWMEWNGPAHLLTVTLLFDANGRFVRVSTVTRV
jgi:hypothetical protein